MSLTCAILAPYKAQEPLKIIVFSIGFCMFFRCRPSMSILRQSAPTLLQFGANFGRLCHQLVPTSAKVGPKLPQVGPKFAQVADFWVQNEPWDAQVADLGGQNGPWDQVNRCEAAPGRHQGGTKEAPGRHQGGTKEAPGRHQGGTKEAPGSELCIDMGPRAPFKSNKVLEHITVNQSALI